MSRVPFFVTDRHSRLRQLHAYRLRALLYRASGTVFSQLPIPNDGLFRPPKSRREVCASHGCHCQHVYTRPRRAFSFAQIYDTLPPDAQRSLLENYLVPLLDDLPGSVSTKVIDGAKEMQMRFMTIPKLDYLAKRTELEGLLSDMERDQKQSQYIKERSTRKLLFEETIDSLSTWVNDIWSVIFEYQTNFRLAHQCLLLAAETVHRMFTPYRGCVFLHLHKNYC